jgi:excisionase family DNA binding protein
MTIRIANSARRRKTVVRLPDKELFRADEVQSLFGLRSVTTVYGWIRDGKIKYVVTPGGQKRIPRSEVERITMEIHVDEDSDQRRH